jgi:hypothetical protein
MLAVAQEADRAYKVIEQGLLTALSELEQERGHHYSTTHIEQVSGDCAVCSLNRALGALAALKRQINALDEVTKALTHNYDALTHRQARQAEQSSSGATAPQSLVAEVDWCGNEEAHKGHEFIRGAARLDCPGICSACRGSGKDVAGECSSCEGAGCAPDSLKVAAPGVRTPSQEDDAGLTAASPGAATSVAWLRAALAAAERERDEQSASADNWASKAVESECALAEAVEALREIANGCDHPEGVRGHPDFYEAVAWAQEIAFRVLASQEDRQKTEAGDDR